jgi:SH3 domain protein
MLKRLILTAALCAWAAPAPAETVYVTDSLRLGLYHSDDTSDKPFLNLVSGTQLEVLERNASLARVRTSGGEEGWVKSAVLVPDKPAQTRVAELEVELAGLRSENAEYRGTRASADESADRLAKTMAASKDSSEAIHEALGQLKRENAVYVARLESYRGALPMPWVAGALLVALAGGFAGGLWWLDALIRRRHGGFRVY